MAPNATESPSLKLSTSITSPVDISRLIREVDFIDESLLQLGLRSGGSPVKVPKTSYLMDKLVRLNGLKLLLQPDRQALKQYLTTIHAQAPVIHISFGADPSAVFTEKLIGWLRREIHQEVLLTIGMQPNLGAGCILRTTNKQFDLSLRQTLITQRNLLMTTLFGEGKA